MARKTLLKNALVIATMDDARREIAGGFILIEGPEIIAIGTAAEPLPVADEVLVPGQAGDADDGHAGALGYRPPFDGREKARSRPLRVRRGRLAAAGDADMDGR